MKLSSIALLALIVTTTTLIGCSKDDSQNKQPDLPEQQIVILYDNDVHCEVDGYPKLVTLRNEVLVETPYVSTVSCGDFASGSITGIASQGESVVAIMNKVGYDIVALGNHELDYGMEQMFNLSEALDAKVLCANLINCQSEQHLFPAYHIVHYGKVDVAFLGLTTTTSGTVKSLADEQGNPLYSFMQDGFYENAQYYINEARSQGADYVVVLAHLGDMERMGHPSSLSLIANTYGVDAVIDGHDHHVIPNQIVTNKLGEAVLLTSSGSNFANVGKLTIDTNGTFSASLIDVATLDADHETQQFVDEIKEQAESKGEYSVGFSEVELSIYDAEGKRIVRTQECNIGDLCADAFRHFTNTDIALINGGGIRANIEQGEVTLNDLYNVMPFGNEAYVANITGKQLLDALEVAVHALPEEAGVFMQVSGMRFQIDTEIPSPVVEEDALLVVEEGARRVSDVQILNPQSGVYEAVDLARKYTMASLDYLILELGGSGVFRQVEPVNTYWGSDIDVLKFYITETLDGKIDSQYATPQSRILFK